MSPPPLFTSIPSEVLELIASHFDRASALSFSRLSQRCAAIAEPYLWRDIDLTAKSTDKAVLRDKARGLMREGTKQRWALVRTVKAALARNTIHSLFQILDHTAKTLASLEVVNLHDRSGNAIDDFDLRFIYGGPQISFPHLTHIRLIRVIHLIEFIPYLCDLALNLLTLDVEIDNHSASAEEAESRLTADLPGRLTKKTKLRSLRLSYKGPTYLYPIDGSEWRYDMHDVRDVLRDLLKSSPRLRQLSADYELEDAPDWFDEEDCFLKSVSRSAKLKDLRWAKGWDMLPDTGSSRCLPKLERLILPFDWSTPFTELPVLPSLELIIFDCSHLNPLHEALPTIPLSSAPTTLSLDPELAVWLRASSRLHIFHFSADIEGAESLAVFADLNDINADNASGTVRSLRHGAEEILHVQLRVEDIGCPSYDVPHSGERQEKLLWRPVLYVGGEWSDAESGTVHSEPVPRDFTDYDGSSVPLEILSKMRELEGVSEDDWERGVEVGDEAWQILMDWRQGRAE